MVLLEATHIDMVALCDVQEDTVDEEEERFNVEELAPAEAQVEEELGETLVVDAFAIKLVSFPLPPQSLHLSPLFKPRLLFRVHEPLIFFIELLAGLIIRV